MRYPDGHKETVRERIVTAAATALRREGLSAVSIPRLMKAAGLTHGGFYAHFSDRDELVAEAIRAAAEQTAKRVFEGRSLEAALATYLSPEHVQHPALGCVVAALGTEGERQTGPVRKAFQFAARGLIKLVDGHLRPGAERAKPSDEALRVTATMVGAVVLARLLDDPPLVERLLRVASHSLAPRAG